MGRKLQFLGWAASVAESVAGHLLADGAGNPPDLSGTLVLLPTRQAGRRLRIALASESDVGGILGPLIVTPQTAFREFGARCNLAGSLAVAGAWTAVLSELKADECRSLFPRREAGGEIAWAHSTGRSIERLRQDLADGGMTLSTIVDTQAESVDDVDRWRDLSLLERRYLERIEAVGMVDPCRHAVETARQPRIDAAIERIVVAALPSPSRLLRDLLRNLSAARDIEILVHADQGLADKFDGWGGLRRDYWCEAEIDIADPTANIAVVNDPVDQADLVLDTIAAESQAYGPDDIALGTPHQEVAELVATRLASEGVATFNPSGEPYAGSSLYILLESFASFESEASLAALQRLISHPAVLRMFELRGQGAPDDILMEMDGLRERHLCREIDDLRAVLRRDHGRYPLVEDLIAAVDEWLRDFRANGLGQFLRGWLVGIFDGQPLPADAAERSAYEDAAVFVLDAADELDRCAFVSESRRALRLLIQHMRTARRTREREWPAIDLQGWIELHWEDAPLLIAAGMNEGIVPEGQVADIFLPDSLRRDLGLISDRDRLARDVYYMTAICEKRRSEGRAVFVLGRYAGGGDPLKPSRLFFHCRAAEVLERAEQIFRAPPEQGRNEASEIRLLLDPAQNAPPREHLIPEHLSPSAISDYLACPFRFYLKRVLGMRAYDCGKSELDPADYGNLIHLTLKSIGPQPEKPVTDDANILAGMLEKELQRQVVRLYGENPAVPVRIQIETAANRLRAFACQQIDLWRAGWDIVATEREFEIEIDGMPLRGIIDRIDRHRRSGRLRLIDYKTSESAISPYKYHFGPQRDAREYALAGKQAWKNLQLPLYRMMLPPEMRGASAIEVALWNLPKAVSEGGLLLWEDFDDYLPSARDCVGGVIADLRAHRFWPPRERVDHDDFECVFPHGVADYVDRDAFLAFLEGGRDGEN